jgi:hypothetical protein
MLEVCSDAGRNSLCAAADLCLRDFANREFGRVREGIARKESRNFTAAGADR